MKYMAQPGAPPAAWQGPLVQRTSSKDEFNNPPRTQKFGHSRCAENRTRTPASPIALSQTDERDTRWTANAAGGREATAPNHFQRRAQRCKPC